MPNREQITDAGMRIGLIAPTPPAADCPLFPSTRQAAGQVAARYAGHRYQQILQQLAQAPACIFEIAARLECFDHQISGRFGELTRANLIERTNCRRTKPATGCQCDEYRLTLIGHAALKGGSNEG